MPKYTVTLASTRIYTTDITVEAATEEEADQLALEIGHGDIDHPDMPKGWEPEWEYTDGMGVEVVTTEEVANAQA